MSLSDLASLGSFVSGFAVLASLVYLAFQVRQAERAIRANTRQSRATYGSNVLLAVNEQDNLSSMMRILFNAADITPLDMVRYRAIVTVMLNGWRVIFENHQDRLTREDETHWLRATIARVIATPSGRVAWGDLRDQYPETFQAYVDEILAKTPPRFAPPTVEGWRSEVAKHMAADWQAARNGS